MQPRSYQSAKGLAGLRLPACPLPKSGDKAVSLRLAAAVIVRQCQDGSLCLLAAA